MKLIKYEVYVLDDSNHDKESTRQDLEQIHNVEYIWAKIIYEKDLNFPDYRSFPDRHKWHVKASEVMKELRNEG